MESFLEYISSLLEKSKLTNTSIEKIEINYDTDHYYCTTCHKFPIIKI